MAAKLDAALLGVTHFTKGSEGRSPIDRVTGSVAFGALARVVMVATREQDGDDGKPGQRVLMRAKSNIGRDDGGFKYDLQLVPMREYPEIIVPVVSWGASVSGTAREICCDRGHGWQWRGHGAPGSRGFSARFPNGRAETREGMQGRRGRSGIVFNHGETRKISAQNCFGQGWHDGRLDVVASRRGSSKPEGSHTRKVETLWE